MQENEPIYLAHYDSSTKNKFNVKFMIINKPGALIFALKFYSDPYFPVVLAMRLIKWGYYV